MCRECGCEDGNARAYFEGRDGRAEVATRVEAGPDGTLHVHLEISGLGPAGPRAHRHAHAHVHDDGSGRVHTFEHEHVHAHDHDHHHEHQQEHVHDHDREHDSGRDAALAAAPAGAGTRRRIELESRVLERNDREAARNRAWLDAHGVVAINLISSPGSGKTLLLERTLEGLRGRVACAVITGDQSTDNDARRLVGKGAPVVQIETRAACHLNAEQVGAQLERVVTGGVRLLIIENVGNLVCPAAFDLGERHKLALLSVTEGEDKPLKYPVLFHDAPVCVITKTDLLPHLEFDMARCREAIRAVRPDVTLFELSARTGDGMAAWLRYLEQLAG
jgi:hydrogenase nickel incorporation protein HypB